MVKKEVKQCECSEPTGVHPETDQLGFWMACNDCGGELMQPMNILKDTEK